MSYQLSKDTMDARHLGKGNFLFFDGHVKAIKLRAATAAWGGAHSGSMPWADSNDWTLTDFNDHYH
jgi:prepilin-type processing-associated H-X9-DG protein